MDKTRKAFRLTGLQFMYSFCSPKYWVSIVTEILFSLFYILRYKDFAEKLAEPVNVMEGYLCVASSEYKMTILVFLFVFVLSDIPFMHDGFNNEIMRAGNGEWIAGKLIYIFLSAVLFQMVILVTAAFVLSPYAFSDNLWSFTFTKLVREGNTLSADALDYDGIRVLMNFTPFGAVAAQEGLMILYTSLLGSLMFMVSLFWNKLFTILLVTGIHLGGFALCISRIKYMFMPFANAVLPIIYSGAKYGNIYRAFSYLVTMFAAVIIAAFVVKDRVRFKE